MLIQNLSKLTFADGLLHMDHLYSFRLKRSGGHIGDASGVRDNVNLDLDISHVISRGT